ncbi:VPS10 domain-containing protein [Phaeocystidibacter luteus]|uniref:T9SS type A sorting domain-containing protein n=1 Tax=Phaeocystidibacter luteus TaxID=911197 RepID=A0A6N6RHN1_9FLAO|nr:PKD domain-containing protein [Phaeocystidibacter luteus]KAB2813888.1 T9SS type A sorting domain-containing protein [Phaeocystidibacter luteus]
MKNLRFALFGVLSVAFGTTFAQVGPPRYVEEMADPSVNFYDVQQSFEEHWDGKEVERSQGWKQFKRWEAFMEPRVYPTGERPNPTILYDEAMKAGGASVNLGNWSHIGPYDGNALNGIGRVNCVTFHPENNDIMFIGAPAGGIWKTTDGGLTWSTNTDLLPNLGVSDIAIDPHNPDTMYIATGDRDAADTYSIGLMKSTDGGASWQTTGLSYSLNQSRRIGGIYINPKNTQEIVVATRVGIQRSVDGGATFSQVQGGSWQMLTFVPTATDTLFAGSNSGGNIVRSVDAGATWSALSSGLPTGGVTRVEVATTADDPNYVYALFSASNNGLGGIYRSTDGGNTWTQQFSGATQNLLHWSSNPGGNVSGGSTGGQGWYDLAIAVSPVNKNAVYVGGVNVWRSLNGGTSWSLSAHWFGGGGAAFAHADQHWFEFEPGTNNLYVGNDGGVYRTSNGTNYTELSDGLHITQYYKIDVSQADENLTIGGAQDNGTHLNDVPSWDRVKGGDGMDNAIANNNPNVMYAASQYGNFDKSTNRGQSFNASFNLPPNGQGQWVTPFVIDPSNDNILYAGYDQLWKSTNAGLSFSQTSGSIAGNTSGIDVIAVSKSNGQVIYVAINDDVYRSSNGGSTWTNISNNISNSRSVTDIAISDVDPNHIWITKSGYDSNHKVYESLDGGSTWSNISSGLPNLPANTIIYQDGSNGAIYVGMDIGVYYRDLSSNGWVAFMNGIPNTIVNDLEIHYATGVIRAGTYGRGVWESPLANTFLGKPQADFRSAPGAVCTTADTVELVDMSTYAPTIWDWQIYPSTFTFVGGTNAQSQHPKVLFTANGQYTVQLIASNRFGSDTLIKVAEIGVGGYALPFAEDFAIGLPEDWEVVNADNSNTWSHTSASNGGSGSMYMDFYSYNGSGEEDELILPPLDFTGKQNVQLTYDMAYRQYSAGSSDSLKIYVSTDCGSTWTLVDARGENGTQNFATGTPLTSAFTPSNASDWRNDMLSLSAYDGMDEVRIKFVSVNAYGNNLYLDNININGAAGAAPVADFFANSTACEGSMVTFYNLAGSNGQNYSWTFQGGTPSTSTAANPTVTYNTAGTYNVSLVVSNGIGSDSIYKSSFIAIQTTVTPSVTITANSTAVCAGEDVEFYASTMNGGSNGLVEWFVNGQQRPQVGDTITLASLSNNDTVVAVLSSSEACVSTNAASSNSILMTINPLPTVNAGSYTTQCVDGSAFALTGSPSGGTYSGRGVSGTNFDPADAGPGTHTITYEYTDANGCTNTATTTILVESKPNVFLSAKTYCESDPAEGAGGGFPTGGTYSVNGSPASNIDPSALGVGKHYLEYSYSNGVCTTVKGDTIVVLAAPTNPTITVEWGKLTCNQVGYQYQWLDASGTPIPGETDRIFYPQTPGDYAVRVRAGSSCDETSGFVNIQNISVEEHVAGQINLRAYPNPTSDDFALYFTLEDTREVSVELVDVAGKVIDVQNLGTVNGDVVVPFNLKSFAKGVYFVKLTVGDVTITNRVVRQ